MARALCVALLCVCLQGCTRSPAHSPVTLTLQEEWTNKAYSEARRQELQQFTQGGFSLSNPAPNPDEVLDGLAHVARLFNVFAADGVPPKNLKVVAIFHGSAGYAAMDNGIYRAKFNVNNPNLKIIQELKTAGVQLLLCGQTLHDLNLNEQDLLPDIKLATSAAIVLVTYQNDGYALMPF